LFIFVCVIFVILILCAGYFVEKDYKYYFINPGHLIPLGGAYFDSHGDDIDNDGMPNDWELSHDLSNYNASDVNLDVDEDGLTNLQEYQNGTNPNKFSTVNDGISDGWKVKHDLNPLDKDISKNDPDNDSLENLGEFKNETDPHDLDSDNDGFKDGTEVIVSGLNPLDPDVDRDGLLDGKDEDRDNMSNWFERNVSPLYDPLVKNNRYVILAEFEWNSVKPEWSKEEYEKQYNFFNRDMKIPAKNIYKINHTQLTWDLNDIEVLVTFFKDVTDNLSVIVDKNDFLFVAYIRHGGKGATIYDFINNELNKIETKAQCILVNSCYSGGSLKYFNQTSIPRVIITDANENQTSGIYDLIDTIYPSIKSEKHRSIHEGKLIHIDSKPDKDNNGFVSIKEAFNSSKDIYFSLTDMTPQISDKSEIAENLYFGEYAVED